MEEDLDNFNRQSSFAITAKALGHPSKLYTPIAVFNLESEVPKAAIVNAMWDTGCATCVMSKSLADILGIEFEKESLSKGLTGSEMCPIGCGYVSLVAGSGILTVYVSIVDDHIGGKQYSFIIGMQVIRLGTLTISSTPAATTLSFIAPSGGLVDYTRNAPSDMSTKVTRLSKGNENLVTITGKDVLDIIRSVMGDQELPYFPNVDG